MKLYLRRTLLLYNFLQQGLQSPKTFKSNFFSEALLNLFKRGA